jgi:hypothetical protein
MSSNMQNPDETPSNKESSDSKESTDSKKNSGNSPEQTPEQIWSHQINQSFLFSPYFGPSDKHPLTASTIQIIALKAEYLLDSLKNYSADTESAFVVFVQNHVDDIVATITELSFNNSNVTNSITKALLRTQRRLTEFGEIASAEVEEATMLPPANTYEPIMGATASGFFALSVGDASAALAAQRAGLSSELGRGVFAAELILELRDVLHSHL